VARALQRLRGVRPRYVLKSAFARSPWFALALAAACGTNVGGGGQATPSDGGGSPAPGGSSSGSSSGPIGSSSGGGSSSGSGGSSSGGGEAGVGADATTPTDAAPEEASTDAPAATSGRQVLVWTPTYLNFAQSLTAVTSTTPKAFTEVSPDFYKMNSSLPPSLQGADSNGNFDGLSIAQVATQIHAAGMKLLPLMYGPDDSYYQTFLTDSGAQSTFVTWLVTEAQTNGYDGWNIDWEPGSVPYPQYGTQYVSFLRAAKAALNAKNLILTVDIGGWYIAQCGNGGGIDLTQIGPAVDVAIIEDYAGGLGPPNPLSACPGGTPAATVSCAPDPNNYFGAQLNLMCDVSLASAVNIGLINGKGGTGANPFLPSALDSIAALGFTQVAVWPDESTFLTSTNIPAGATWYSLLAQFLAH
jgi:hypothetical protein